MGITLEQAREIVRATLSHGRAQAFGPLTVAVLDPGGQITLLEREDGSGILRPEIAIAKAWGALAMGLPSRGLADLAEARPGFFETIEHLADGRLIPAAGGCLIRDLDGQVIGAVGVTGDTSDNDEACALHGIAEAGLRA